MRRSALLAAPLLLLATLATASCDDEEDDASDPPTTTRVTESSVLYLTAQPDGLYCVAYEDANGAVVLNDPRLWIAYPFVLGDSYSGGGCEANVGVSVTSVHDAYPTSIGVFNDVATISRSGCQHETYVQEGWGILGWGAPGCGSRGGFAYVINGVSIAPGADRFALRFGLATGSSWRYVLTGEDGSGRPINGQLSRTVRGTATVAGYYVYVVDQESWTETGAAAAPGDVQPFRSLRLLP